MLSILMINDRSFSLYQIVDIVYTAQCLCEPSDLGTAVV